MNEIRFVEVLQRALLIIGSIISITIFSFSLISTIHNNTPIATDPRIQLWAARFVGDGSSLATVGGNGAPYETPRWGELVVWNLKTCREKWVFRQKSSLRALASSSDGQFLATGDFNGHTKLVSCVTGATVSALSSETGINAVVFSPSSKSIISGSLGGIVAIWDTTTKKVHSFLLTNETILNVAMSADGNDVVATTRSGKGYLFDLLHPGTHKQLRAYDGPFMSEPNAEGVAFAPDGKSFATTCQNHVRLWECPSARSIGGFTTPRNVNSLDFSPDGKSLATVDDAGTLALWDFLAGECRLATNAHSGSSFCVAFSPDGTRVATIGRDDFCTKIWDASTLTLRTTLKRNNH